MRTNTTLFNAIELALADYEAMFGHRLLEAVAPDTGELGPAGRIVTDNGGPFRSLDFELFIMQHPELRHVRTRVKSPGQNGSRERGFGTLEYERLFLDEHLRRAGLWLNEPRTAESSTTPNARTKQSLSTAHWMPTSAKPERPSPPLNKKKSCQLLDAGHEQTHPFPLLNKEKFVNYLTLDSDTGS